MKIHYLQHVPFEGLALIAEWAADRDYTVSCTKLFERDYTLPNVEDFQLLIVLGGPMSIHDEEKYSWMTEEKAFVKAAIEADKLILGICLGAQIIAQILGAEVAVHKHKEIGWFPAAFKDEALGHPLLRGVNHAINAFHWHGERFEIPSGAVHLACSEACDNQAFIFNDKVLGLQFHVEMEQESVRTITDACGDEIIDGKFIQSKDEMIDKASSLGLSANLYNILDNFV